MPQEIVTPSKWIITILALYTLGSAGMVYLKMTMHIASFSKYMNALLYGASNRFRMSFHMPPRWLSARRPLTHAVYLP